MNLNRVGIKFFKFVQLFEFLCREAFRHPGKKEQGGISPPWKSTKAAGRHFATLTATATATRACDIFSVSFQFNVPAVILAQVQCLFFFVSFRFASATGDLAREPAVIFAQVLCRIFSVSLHFNRPAVVLCASAMQKRSR